MAKAIVKKFLSKKEGSVLRVPSQHGIHLCNLVYTPKSSGSLQEAWVQRLDPECERQAAWKRFGC